MALWDLITNDQEVYDAFYYGIEGTSYELNDQGQFKILDTDKYGTNAMWSARSDALNRQQQGTPDDYQTNVDAFEEHIVSGQGNEKFTGFVLPLRPSLLHATTYSSSTGGHWSSDIPKLSLV